MYCIMYPSQCYHSWDVKWKYFNLRLTETVRLINASVQKVQENRLRKEEGKKQKQNSLLTCRHPHHWYKRSEVDYSESWGGGCTRRLTQIN